MHKALLPLLLAIIAPLFCRAQFQPVGALTVFNEDGDKFYLVLDGERQNDVAQTNVRVDELPRPYYSAKIIFEDKSIPTISKNVMIADADEILMDATYRIKKSGTKRVMRGYSSIPYAQNFIAPPGMYVRHFGGAVVTPGVSSSTTVVNNNTTNMSVGVGGVNMNVQVTEPTVSHTTTTTTTTTGGWASTEPGPPVQQGCANGYPMGGSDFNAALATIQETSFDDSRLSTAQSIADGNCLSADQIVRICKLFSFEANKLAFAKSAYERCTEPRNYFKVNNVFSFDASKRELNSFISGR